MYEDMIPILRSDIKIQQHKEYGAIVFDNRHSFHLSISENVLPLINLINGNNSIKTIRDTYNSIHQRNISIEKVKHIIYNQLGNKILNDKDQSTKQNTQTNYIKKATTLIPSEKINFLIQHLTIFYKRNGISVFLILLILTLFYLLHIPKTIHPINIHQIPIYFCLITGSTLLHEIGHITACRNYCIKSKGIGIGIYMGIIPVAFSDVSGIWLLNKRERIIVNISGVYFEALFLCSTYCTGCFLSLNDTYSIALLLLLKCTFNLIPIFKSDGYWILNDLCSYRNLHNSSEEALIQFFSKKLRSTKNTLLSAYYILNKGALVYLLYFLLIHKNLLLYNIIAYGTGTLDKCTALNIQDIIKTILLCIVLARYTIHILIKLIKNKRYGNVKR